MKSWEKIIKEKLEGYEVNPPEGSLADFRQRLDANRNPAKKPSRSFLTFIATAGVAAACLAIVWMMMQPTSIEPLGEQSPIAEVAEKTVGPSQHVLADDSSTNIKPSHVIARAKSVAGNTTSSHAAIDTCISSNERAQEEGFTQDEQHPLIADLTLSAEDTVTHAQDDEPMIANSGEGRKNRHSTPRFTKIQKTWMATGGIVAATVCGAVLPSLGSSDPGEHLCFDNGEGHSGGIIDFDFPLDEADHSMPLKVGLSARWKFADHWALTSGLEYARYKSNVKYFISGRHTQYAHYIGLPLRIDYSIASTRWVEVYIGAGATADYCVKATRSGESIKKDEFSFTLQGAGGIQLNVTKQIGIYVEPQVSWLMPFSGKTLETYRTENPVSFNISTGLRYTIPR